MLQAQVTGDSAATTFRSGQWGVEFLPSRDVTAAGVLRFATPELALVLNGSANVDWNDQPGAGAFGKDATQQSVQLSAQFGPRWYHPVTEHVVRFAGWGISGSYSRQVSTGVTSSHFQTWSAGAYGELGLQYLITRHLSLGCRGTLLATRFDGHSTNDTSSYSQLGYHVGIGPLQITANIYF